MTVSHTTHQTRASHRPVWRILKSRPFKRLYSPLKGTLCSPLQHQLCSPFCSYPAKAHQVPSGIYDVIARTLADYPSNINHINEKKWQEARDRGEWIDIHDYDPAAQNEYDITIRDVDGGKLQTELSEALSIPYLSNATKGDASKVVKYIDGHLYGYKHRPILPCVRTHNGDEARWVFFILDTAAPATYLSPQVSSHLPIKSIQNANLL